MSVSIDPMKTDNDWQQVKNLLLRVPMSSSIPLVTERDGDPDLSYPSFRRDAIHYIAQVEGKVVGYIHGQIEWRQSYTDKGLSSERVAYVGDLRVDPKFRGRRIAQQLMTALVEDCIKQNVHKGYALALKGNEPIMQFLLKNSAFAKFMPIREYTVASKFILKKPKSTSLPYEQIQPSEKAIVNLIDFWNRCFLAPSVSPEEFQSFLVKYPEICFFGKKGNNDQIAFALWEPSRFRKQRFLHFPISLKLVRTFWNLFQPMTQAHPFPDSTTPWRGAHVGFVNHIDEDIESAISQKAWEMGCHTVTVIEEGLGLPSQKMKGPCYRLQVRLLGVSSNQTTPLTAPDSITTHIDLGFV